MDLAEFGLPSRVVALLGAHGIHTLEDLLALNERELRALPKLGGKTLGIIVEALTAGGHELAVDPWAPYECARHGASAWDVSLSGFFLCPTCAEEFRNLPFGGQEPSFTGPPIEGHCSHCNQLTPDLRLYQWMLCGVCERVVRSIGRGMASARFVLEVWRDRISPNVPGIDLREEDAPRLQRRDETTRGAKVSTADFLATEARRDNPLFGIELKTGKSYITGDAIGSRMATFQLDTSDCDDILTVVNRDKLPVYLVHVQVVDRIAPPTVIYSPVALWWTNLFSMRDNFLRTATRPRETRAAAYYNIRMFKGVDDFVAHLKADGPGEIRRRLEKEGTPELYR